MEVKQNPFSIYDFLGYLTPGAVLLYGVLFMMGHMHTNTFDLASIISQLSFEKAEIYIPFILASYIAGHFLSFLSSITVERYSIWAHGYPSKYLLGISKSDYFPLHDRARRSMRFVTGVLLTPISVLDWALGEKLGMRDLYAKKLDQYLIDILRKKLYGLIIHHMGVFPNKDKHGTAEEVDLFRFAYHFAVENAPSHLPKMQNYVALYGFLRTLTFILLLIYWGLWWHTMSGVIPISTGINLMCISAALTYLMFMAFVKFYRRFTLEALMAMAVSYTSEGKVALITNDDANDNQ